MSRDGSHTIFSGRFYSEQPRTVSADEHISKFTFKTILTCCNETLSNPTFYVTCWVSTKKTRVSSLAAPGGLYFQKMTPTQNMFQKKIYAAF